MRNLFGLLVAVSILTAQEPPLTHPADAPDDWMLAHIDVETTGLIPGYHEMIDIGVILSDLDGNEMARTHFYIMPNFPERTSPEVPAINGFDVEKWRNYGALSTSEAVDSLVSFYARHTGGRTVLMVAYNAQFDAAFLDHLFRSADRSWRELHYYYVLDLPSMAWGLGMRDLWGSRIMEKFDIPDEPHSADEHTGLRCATGNIRIYQELMKLASQKTERKKTRKSRR
jgi:DNA polymerase III alpha subunit (gram-positive type)